MCTTPLPSFGASVEVTLWDAPPDGLDREPGSPRRRSYRREMALLWARA
jgi:hypothetical protein